jgi:hypothetical protein
MLRRCGRCGEVKAVDQFTYHACKGRRDAYCKPCRASYGREHYLQNKERYVRQAKERNDRVRAERLEWLLDYLAEHPCVDCGENDPIVLEFDHLGDKEFSIAYGINNRRWDLVLDEIEKCEVRCANCHRRRSAERGDFTRARFARERLQRKGKQLDAVGPPEMPSQETSDVPRVERVKGIEPSSPAWKAGALPLSYTREKNNSTERGSAQKNRRAVRVASRRARRAVFGPEQAPLC